VFYARSSKRFAGASSRLVGIAGHHQYAALSGGACLLPEPTRVVHTPSHRPDFM